jgi:hypothetical protein
LLTQNVLLLQKSWEKDVKSLKEEMKKDLQKERERHRREMQDVKVKFSTHTTNVYHSTCTFIQPSAVLMSSDSLLKFTSL